MIIFLYGKDIYRRELKVRELLKANREKRKDADIRTFNLEDDKNTWREARDFLLQPSMFSETKTLVVYGSGEVDIKEWRELLKKEITSVEHIIIISDNDAPKKNFSFLLDSQVRSSEYKELTGKTLDVFLKKEAEVRGVKFEKDAWEKFLFHTETFPLKSAVGVRELEKIALFMNGETITQKELSEIIQVSEEESVSSLARAIAYERDKKKRLAILEEAFLKDVDIPYLFNSLVYSVRNRKIVLLADLDVAIKSGNADYETALLQFVLTD